MATEKRLINANALLERLNDSSESWAKNLQAIRNWWPHAVGIKDNISRLIRESPTVDAVEVVHGRWISLSTLWGKKSICSVCGRDLYVNEPGNGLPNIEDLHYCPDCGARMDGDGK